MLTKPVSPPDGRSSRRRIGRWLGLLSAFGLLASVGVDPQPAHGGPGDANAGASAAGPAGERRIRVIRSWRDTVKLHGRDVPRTVEVIYDYDAGVARQRVYDEAGTLVSVTQLADQPQPSIEERAEAYQKVRDDGELGSLARAVGAQLDGGFILNEAEGERCGPGTRCIQVFMLSQSRWGLQRHSVVDLRDRRVAYRSYRQIRTD